MPWEAASCLTPCSQVAKSPPHGAALATLGTVASKNKKKPDEAPSGRRMMAPRLVAPAGKFNRKPFLRPKHGKVQAQNPVILRPASNGGQSDGAGTNMVARGGGCRGQRGGTPTPPTAHT